MSTLTLKSGSTITLSEDPKGTQFISVQLSPEEVNVLVFTALCSIPPSIADKIIADINAAFEAVSPQELNPAFPRQPLRLNPLGILPTPSKA